MNTTLIGILTALAFAGFAGIADAQEDDDELEATIRLMGADEAELPEAVTREIVLPPSVSEDSAAVEAAAQGLDTANEARSLGGDAGQDIANEARSGNPGADARENAADMAESAREHAENRSRGEDSRPDPPAPPERPDPPEQSGQI